MSDQVVLDTRPLISGVWWGFQSDNYYDPAPHDRQAALQAQLDFARKTEAAIRGMFPENLPDLAQRFGQFPGIDDVLRNASYLGPEAFYQDALIVYKGVQTARSSDLLDFAQLVRDFQQVTDSIREKVNDFPPGFFNIYYVSRDRLLEHVYRVIVDLLAGQLRSLVDDWDRFWALGGPEDEVESEVFRCEFIKRFMPPLAVDPRAARLKALLRQCEFEPAEGFFAFEVNSVKVALDFLPQQIEDRLSDVVRPGNRSDAGNSLTAEERALGLEVYAVFTDLATHYLTEFAPTQTDLIADRPFLTPTYLADVLFVSLKDALKFVWDGKTVSDLKG